VLKRTPLEPGFRPNNLEAKRLIDFVDEQGVDELSMEFRDGIDKVRTVHIDFTDSNVVLKNDIHAIKTLLSISPTHTEIRYSPTVRIDFHSLEQHATELAKLLKALVAHYDLCVTAIKHTEGGGDLVEQVKNELPEGIDLGSIEHLGPSQPMSDEDRADMMQILDNDATEVEDVVQDISNHAADMEIQLKHVNTQLASLTNEEKKLSKASRLLDCLGGKMGSFIKVCAGYRSCWETEKRKIEGKLEDFEAAREFYDGFLQSYDKLLLEAARRKVVDDKMRKIMEEAMTKLKRLYDGEGLSARAHDLTDIFEGELEERNAFKHDQGHYLPLDIWPGLGDEPTMFAFQEVELCEEPKAALRDSLS